VVGRRYNRRMIDRETLEMTMRELGEPGYRAEQVYRALTRGLTMEFAEMSVLPAPLRAALADRLRPVWLQPVEVRRAGDGAVEKTLFEAGDGQPVEAVLMTYPKRATVCVSTQVGCAVRCAFCASGRLGLQRDLSAEEMVDQVLHFARRLRDAGRRVTNVVFMGMGEPFHNYDETLRACRMLNDPQGFSLAARAISVSTAGVVPGIERFAAEPLQLNLAVSLHAATDDLRARLVPLGRTYPLQALMSACEAYVRRTRRKLLFEYVVLPGLNDTDEQLSALVGLLHRPLYHLNLISCHETDGGVGSSVETVAGATRTATSAGREEGEPFAPVGARRLAALRVRLEKAGLAVTVRRSPGEEIEAACGQLALRGHDDRLAGRETGERRGER
jgi:23S rRNA (adenine2503-C2)-methyltransferase